MAKKSPTRLTRPQVIQVNDVLKSVLEQDGEYWRYKEGHSDETVAEKFNVTPTTIVGVRLDLYGRIRKASTSGVEELQRKLDTLLAEHHDLVDRFNKLVTALALNKVADVRHLVFKVTLPPKA